MEDREIDLSHAISNPQGSTASTTYTEEMQESSIHSAASASPPSASREIQETKAFLVSSASIGSDGDGETIDIGKG